MKDEANQWLDRNAAQRKTWYSSVAKAYDYARPRYPKQLIRWAVELAQLTPESTILEVGCGPGIATVAFAELGFSMLCLEPSFQMCELARQNCQSYSNVKFQQTLFEEWQREKRFNAFLAANSFHWMPAQDRYIKASEALQEQGFLILLWNLSMQPTSEVYQALNEVYQLYAPSLVVYEDQNRQEEILQELGQSVIESGYFKNLVTKYIPCQKTYNIDDYLILLSTFSPYIGLNSDSREALFDGIREKIEKNYNGKISLSYLSAVQVAQKI